MKKTIVFMIFLTLLLAACQQGQTITTGNAFVGGDKGLILSFVASQPPSDIFDKDSPFQISLKVDNQGEFDILDASTIIASITGISAPDFGLTTAQLTKTSSDALIGVHQDANKNKLPGGLTTIDFPEMQYKSEISGTVPLTLRADVCYEYGTAVQGKLCVRKDLMGVTGQSGICDPNRQISAENSGAPVQVDVIKQNVAGSKKISILLNIKKVSSNSTGSVYMTGSKCSQTISNQDVVYVSIDDTGLGDITCTGLKDGTKTSGYVKLTDGTYSLICTQTVDNPQDFEKVIKVNLKYAYDEHIDTILNVKHVEG